MTRDQITTVMTAIREGILVRKGYVITEEVADERARNMVTGLMADIDDMIEAALKEAARGIVVVGEIPGPGAQPHSQVSDDEPTRLAQRLIK